ncbi:MAG: hypothetical protein JWR07_5363 [Nevskia sp.]|nr:hypothetical protein [Nevskia sp.]
MNSAKTSRIFTAWLAMVTGALLAACGSHEIDPEYRRITGLEAPPQALNYEDLIGDWRNVWKIGNSLLIRQAFSFLPDHTTLYQVSTRDYSTNASVYILYRGTASVSNGTVTASLNKIKEVVLPSGNSCAFCNASIAPDLTLVNDRLLLVGPFDQFGVHGAFISAKDPAGYAEKLREVAGNIPGAAVDLAAELGSANPPATAPAAPLPDVAGGRLGAVPENTATAATPAAVAGREPTSPATLPLPPPSPEPTCQGKLAEHREQDNAQPYSTWNACQGLRYMIQSQSEYLKIVQNYCPHGVPPPFQGVPIVRGAVQSEQQFLPAVCSGQ